MLRGDAGGDGHGHDVPALHRRLLPGQSSQMDRLRPFSWSRLRNDRPDHLWRDGGREELHAGLGAQLPLLELRARLRRGRHDVRHCRPLSRGSADHAEERTRARPARKAAVSYGALSLGGKVDAHSKLPDLKSQQSI